MVVPEENIYSLNGLWHFIKDADGMLLYNNIADLVDSPELLPQMDIPQNWQLAGLENFNGSVWFFRYFDFKTKKDSLKNLVFTGVDYFTDVWLNGIYLGPHEGYFQKFHFNITDRFTDGSNLLVVKVTSPREEPGVQWPDKKKLIKGIFNHHDCRPGGWSPEYGQDKNTGGIWNDVYIESGGQIYIDNIKVTSKLDSDKAVIVVLVNYESKLKQPLEEKVIFEITSPSGKKIVRETAQEFLTQDSEIVFPFNISDPELWWSWDLGKQNLYSLTVASPAFNKRHITFGIKEVKLDSENNFFINNKRLFLRGTNIIPTQWLSSLTPERIRSQVELIKEANINVIRIHAHVNRPEFYDECDRQGILVWQDFALQWTYDESEEFVTSAVRQIKDMVRQYNNHPSIAFWCCHNEPGEQINTLDTLLYDAVLGEDNSRIVRKASNYEEHPYDGWYWGKPEHFEAAPMGPIVTEFGAQALPEKNSLDKFISSEGLFPPDWSIWTYHNFQYEQTFLIAKIKMGNTLDEFIGNSQDYQAYLLKTAVDSYRRKKDSGITGIFQFMFIDCWESISWSIVDYYGIKKKGYNALRTAYQPVYLSVKLRQDTYLPEDKLNIECWLINDLHKEFQSCRVTIKTGETKLKEFNDVHVPSDSIQKFNWEKMNVRLPSVLSEGRHKIIFEVHDNLSEDLVSSNEDEIRIVSKDFVFQNEKSEDTAE